MLDEQNTEGRPVQHIHVGSMDEDQMSHHGNVATAGSQVQRCALMVVSIIHLHIIATQHEVHLHMHTSCAPASPLEALISRQLWQEHHDLSSQHALQLETSLVHLL